MKATPRSLLKLYALPLSRSSPSHPPLFYLHASKTRSTLPPPNTASSPPSTSNEAPKLPLLTKATDKAADMWSGLGKGKEGGWKKRSYDFGERMMDKIEYEEWALKAIDTTLAPKPWKRSPAPSTSTSTAPDPKPMHEPVELIYPQSLLKSEELIATLKGQLEHREPHHRKAMWKCLILAPFTTPFALLPIVPNFPLFYVLWRAWSHWRAWKSSSYLLSLLSSPSSNLSLQPSSKLDSIYSPLPHDHSESILLLSNQQVGKLVEQFKLDDEERKELERAVGQSQERLKQGRERDGKGETEKVVEAAKEVGKK